MDKPRGFVDGAYGESLREAGDGGGCGGRMADQFVDVGRLGFAFTDAGSHGCTSIMV